MSVNGKDLSKLIDLERGVVYRSLYADPAIYDLELERIFARSWLCLGHESLLPGPNDFMTAYMGEDPVILWRNAEGKLGAYLNLCRHRGNRVCRLDRGNAQRFVCSYHGWVYNSEGKLIGVPYMKEGFMNELDTEQWGLVSVAKLDVYKGLVFATFDPEAPPLVEYLGEAAWYLDILLDWTPQGAEFIGGTRKWTIDCNWKTAAENFASDMAHVVHTHGASVKVGLSRSHHMRDLSRNAKGFTVHTKYGHGFTLMDIPDGLPIWEVQTKIEPFQRFLEETMPEAAKRLGEVRTKGITLVAANIFPNLSFSFIDVTTARVWHPRGPGKIEAWEWTVVPKGISSEAREEMRQTGVYKWGPAGMFDQDDMDNWAQMTQSARGWASRQVPMNYQMHMSGPGGAHEDLPGHVSALYSEENARLFYRHWLDQLQPEAEG